MERHNITLRKYHKKYEGTEILNDVYKLINTTKPNKKMDNVINQILSTTVHC